LDNTIKRVERWVWRVQKLYILTIKSNKVIRMRRYYANNQMVLYQTALTIRWLKTWSSGWLELLKSIEYIKNNSTLQKSSYCRWKSVWIQCGFICIRLICTVYVVITLSRYLNRTIASYYLWRYKPTNRPIQLSLTKKNYK